ncbi:MAG: response regulator [Bacteroidia bacterium]
MVDIKRGLQLLHVDDDVVDATSLRRSLDKLKLSHQLRHAANGRKALDMLQQDPAYRPDVILLDLNMPVMGGLEFLKELRQDSRLKSITVFILSTSDFPPDVSAAYSLNVAGYLVKPFSSSEFNIMLDQLFRLLAVYEFP